jgi:hypothetical protein
MKLLIMQSSSVPGKVLYTKFVRNSFVGFGDEIEVE